MPQLLGARLLHAVIINISSNNKHNRINLKATTATTITTKRRYVTFGRVSMNRIEPPAFTIVLVTSRAFLNAAAVISKSIM
eukprot:m.49591 g.49591  ORF g.49591 m.49591 type:complete len:81 (+) comp10621_c0_seq3:476-718(+)